MARICDLCGRDYNSANSRSHSNIATKRRQLVNLQVKVVEGVKSRVCTRCLRTIKKGEAEKAAKAAIRKPVAKKGAVAAKKPVAKKVLTKKAARKLAKKTAKKK